MTGLLGNQVKDPNFRLRFFLIVFCGIMGFGITLAWRSALFIASEYQEMPQTKYQLNIRKQNEKKRQSFQNKFINKYQIEE